MDSLLLPGLGIEEEDERFEEPKMDRKVDLAKYKSTKIKDL
jgi:hypothetical protein